MLPFNVLEFLLSTLKGLMAATFTQNTQAPPPPTSLPSCANFRFTQLATTGTFEDFQHFIMTRFPSWIGDGNLTLVQNFQKHFIPDATLILTTLANNPGCLPPELASQLTTLSTALQNIKGIPNPTLAEIGLFWLETLLFFINIIHLK